MKIGTKLVLLGIVSMLIGTAFASPLLLSELDIVPFYKAPEGPKADFTINVAYANFTVHDQASNMTSGPYNLSIIDYSIVLNVTNHSNLRAEVGWFDFSSGKDITVVPCALGGYSITTCDSSDDGHGSAGLVEGLWLDGEWLNTTWVPEGGLDEIYGTPGSNPPIVTSLHEKIFAELNITVHSYGFGATRPIIEGGNYWLEGVPLHEYIYDNEVVATLIYTNGTWTDVTGRVEVIEKPYVGVTNSLVHQRLTFKEDPERCYASPTGSAIYSGADGFNVTWAPYESRLIMISGTTDVGATSEGVKALQSGEITVFVQTVNHVPDSMLNGTSYLDTTSNVGELKTIQLQMNENQYVYNTILSDVQKFVTDEFGVEAFIVERD
ncbi:MAG: hypothetical protein NWF02_01210 [Candidatus Bathyarchaeota archaeon]|nr:hypothetical protein [Candidatus Bathyarchaeum sp.]